MHPLQAVLQREVVGVLWAEVLGLVADFIDHHRYQRHRRGADDPGQA